MFRPLSFVFATVVLTTVAAAGPVSAVPLAQLRDALKQRYPLSRIEVQSRPNEGAVIERGAILTLEADGVPAKRLRIIQANTKSPRFHVHDYARIEIAEGGVLRAGQGDFTLAKGTRLVVLDLKVEAGGVRLFTHTTEPVALPGGGSAYGCAEFVFRFGGTPERPDLARVEQVIEHWLPFAG